MGFPGGARTHLPVQEMEEARVRSLDWKDPLEEGMTTHSYSCLENPMDRGAWQATVHRVTKNQTQLKRLSTITHVYYFKKSTCKWIHAVPIHVAQVSTVKQNCLFAKTK